VPTGGIPPVYTAAATTASAPAPIAACTRAGRSCSTTATRPTATVSVADRDCVSISATAHTAAGSSHSADRVYRTRPAAAMIGRANTRPR